MNYRTVLLTSVATIALATNASARQGDTYLTFFGGFSSGESPDFTDRTSATSSLTVTSFQSRKTVNVIYTTVNFTTGTPTFTAVFKQTYTVLGTLLGTYKLSNTTQFSGAADSTGWVLGAGMGVELFDNIRGEAELAFRRFDFDDNAILDTANHYRRRYRLDAYYSNIIPISTGTRTTILTTTQKNFVSSFAGADLVAVAGTTNAPAQVDGELTSFSLMANLWYDFPIGDSGLKTFVGGGIGVANLTLSYDFLAQSSIPEYIVDRLGTVKTPTGSATITTTTTSTTFRTPSADLKEDAAVFAYQFGAGLGYEFDNGIMLAAQYRYFATTDGDFGDHSENVESSDVIFSISFPFGRAR